MRHSVALGMIVAAASIPAMAQGPDTSSWRCSRCPFKSGYEASNKVSGSFVSDDSARFGDSTGYDEQGGYLNLDSEGSIIEGDLRTSWSVEDLGIDSRTLTIERGRQGQYDFYAGYSALPRRQFNTTKTVFSMPRSDSLALPSDWVRAALTSEFSLLEESLAGLDIASDRETIELGARYLPKDRFEVFTDYRQTNREGLNVQGAGYFTNSSLLPRPFEYRTDELDIGVRYGGDSSTVKLAYYGSFFKDKNRGIRWENPFTSVSGADVGAIATPPDSSFQQLIVSGSYRPDWYKTFVTYSAATGIMEQSDSFLPYTTNPNVLSMPLPNAGLEGQVNTTNLALTVTAQPYTRLRVKGAYRYDDRDNRTPFQQWNRVIVDSFNSGEFESNVPYSFKRERLNLDARFDLTRDLRFAVGYDYAAFDRDFQEVAEQEEMTGWGQLNWQPNTHIDLRARAGTSKRYVDRYDTAISVSHGQNPLMRKYNLAYRYREFGEFTISASLPNRPISVSGTVLVADDNYTESQLGLLASDEFRVAVDISWSPKPLSFLYLAAALDDIDSEQAGSEFQQTIPDWYTAHADEFATFSAGYRVEALFEQFDLEIDYTHSVGNSDIAVSVTGRDMSQLPSLESILDSLRARLLYRATERLVVDFELRYESFTADDWALQGVGPATIPQVLTLGATPYDYDVFLIGLGVRYSY